MPHAALDYFEDSFHMDYSVARERARTAAARLQLTEPVSMRSIQAHLDPDHVVSALKRTDLVDEPEVSAELVVDRLASRIRRSCRQADAEPDNVGAVFG
ncbi:hypothetical protein [Arthrobacter sp. NicSoilB8]|uniref:hypothetical protein n=1 Tax=Arthrobacter sp. NicSoilB8 TaxID=2830998 RepID=UPI001CC67D33|nr:hypothetical protein [Arthrobacter sp. NicSoilB8]